MSERFLEQTSWSNSKWLSKCAAAKYIHRSPAALQKMLDAGVIPAVQAPFSRGGKTVVYISIDDLDAFMRSTPYVPDPSGAAYPRESCTSEDRKGHGLIDISEMRIPAYRAIAQKGRAVAS